MKIMVVNCGSSSIKYQIFEMPAQTVLASGLLERIGEADSRLDHKTRRPDGEWQAGETKDAVADHRGGFQLIGETLRRSGALSDPRELAAIGHRVVHGGEAFQAPTLIDEAVIDTIRELIPLAPLHNPANLVGIEVARETAPGVPQAAVFDTAFHQTIPPRAFHYALPRRLYTEDRVRRYGFHGTSHAYVSRAAARFLERPQEALNLITLHLGNGASAAAVAGGRSIDTSMGLTPLEGLIMGTRCGDIDPAIIFYLGRETGRSIEAIDALLNKESGLKGLCGENDMRAVTRLAREGHADARLAIDMVGYRLRKYIGAYYAALGRLDAVVFTGGVGENAAEIRSAACQGLEALGIDLDPARNRAASRATRAIHRPTSRVGILVIPTNEELEIATATQHLLEQQGLDGPAGKT
jgi:acetate kinase